MSFGVRTLEGFIWRVKSSGFREEVAGYMRALDLDRWVPDIDTRALRIALGFHAGLSAYEWKVRVRTSCPF